MRMVTINIGDDEWELFEAWCTKLQVKYKTIYEYEDATLVKVPAWFVMQWLQGEYDEEEGYR